MTIRKAADMLGPKTDNKITDGNHNAQIGHNTGSVVIGLTFEQHQLALEKAKAEKAADLDRAHGAEKDLILREMADLQTRLRDVERDYEHRLKELSDRKAELAVFHDTLDKTKFNAAIAALDIGETALAEALLRELLVKASARTENAKNEEAGICFRLGKIAEAKVNWHDAYTHYKRAAALDPTLDHLKSDARMAWRLAKGAEAETLHKQLMILIKDQFGDQSEQYATQLNNFANVVEDQGRYPEAEALLRQALEIIRATNGEAQPSFATNLSNLADVVGAQGRLSEAETLYRQALEIDRATIGEAHPNFAIRLNNLAVVVQAQGRYPEAEALYRQALAIDRATIGEAHPDYATHLNNLAAVVGAQGRGPEAEALFAQALEITRAALGEAHPDFAMRLANLGSYLAEVGRGAQARDHLTQALTIFRAALPADHPDIAEALRRLNALPPEN